MEVLYVKRKPNSKEGLRSIPTTRTFFWSRMARRNLAARSTFGASSSKP